MKKRICLAFGLALLCATLSTATFASENAYLYLVQGIPGRDYSATTDPQFPVDIQIDSKTCNEHGLAFGSIAGPLTLAPGTYTIKVSVANSLAPCSNPAIVQNSIALEAGEDASVVVTLNESGAPTLMTFDNNFSTVTASTARVLLAQASDTPLQVIFENTVTKKVNTYTVNPGASLDADLPAGAYTVEINQGTTTLVPSTTLHLDSQSVAMLFAVGQAGNDTVVLETKTVRDVI